MAFVDNGYIEAVLSAELRNTLLSNQGTYDAGLATTTLAALIATNNAKVQAACLQVGVANPGARDLLKAIAGALVIIELYGRQGLEAPTAFTDTAKLLESIRTGDLPIPEETADPVGGVGGISFTPYKSASTPVDTTSYVEPFFSRSKVRF